MPIFAPQQQSQLDAMDQLLAQLQANRQQWDPGRPQEDQLAVIRDRLAGQQAQTGSNVDDIIRQSVARNQQSQSDMMSPDPAHYAALRNAPPVVDPNADTPEDIARRAQVVQDFATAKASGTPYGAGDPLQMISSRPANSSPRSPMPGMNADFEARNAIKAAGRGTLNPYKANELVQTGVVPQGVFSPAVGSGGGDLQSLIASGQLAGLAPAQRADLLLKAAAMQQQQRTSDLANQIAQQQLATHSADQRYVADKNAEAQAGKIKVDQSEADLRAKIADRTMGQKEQELQKEQGLVAPSPLDSVRAIKPGLNPDQVASNLSGLGNVTPEQEQAIRLALNQAGYGPDFFDQMAEGSTKANTIGPGMDDPWRDFGLAPLARKLFGYGEDQQGFQKRQRRGQVGKQYGTKR